MRKLMILGMVFGGIGLVASILTSSYLCIGINSVMLGYFLYMLIA